MSEQSPKNIWEVVPDFSQMWKDDNNYGCQIAIEGIYATVSTYTVTRKEKRYVHHLGIIRGFNVPLLQNDTTSFIEAKKWCESWLRHFYKYTQQQKQVECYQGWLKHYEQDNDALRTKLHEYELREIREKFRAEVEQGGQA